MSERSTPTSERVGASGTESSSPSPGPAGRRAVILGRLLLLSAAALALGAALALVRERDRSDAQARAGAVARYVCPMHPQVTSPVQGECPICHMELERVAGGAEPEMIKTRTSAVELVRERTVSQMIRAPAWVGEGGLVTATLHRDDLVGVEPGEQALFFASSAPGIGIPVQLSPARPEPWGGSIVLARFRAVRAAPDQNDTGWVQLSPRPRTLLVVPVSAVLYSGDGAYVLAAPPDGHTFTRRTVQVGRILDSGYGAGLVDDRTGGITVLSGLKEGERVVVGDTFFLDAERRLQAARGNEAEVIR